MDDYLGAVLQFVQDVDPLLRTILAGVGILLETSILVGLVIPGDSIVIVASTGVASPFEFVGLMLAVIIGALCGESIGFALGRYFGPKIRRSRLGRRIGEAQWSRAEHYLDRRGGIAVFISRFLPVFHSLIPLTVGMSTMSYARFIRWTTPACILWAGLYVSVGTFAGGTYRDLSDNLHYAGYIFVGIIVGFGVILVVAKRLLQRREERHMVEVVDRDNDAVES